MVQIILTVIPMLVYSIGIKSKYVWLPTVRQWESIIKVSLTRKESICSS